MIHEIQPGFKIRQIFRSCGAVFEKNSGAGLQIRNAFYFERNLEPWVELWSGPLEKIWRGAERLSGNFRKFRFFWCFSWTFLPKLVTPALYDPVIVSKTRNFHVRIFLNFRVRVRAHLEKSFACACCLELCPWSSYWFAPPLSAISNIAKMKRKIIQKENFIKCICLFNFKIFPFTIWQKVCSARISTKIMIFYKNC